MDEMFAFLRSDPCGARLLEAAAGLPVHVVGGAVRDVLLGDTPRELDVVVEGPVDELAARLGDEVTEHSRFGTATVRAGACRFDLAAARAETYPAPGALPDVRPAGIEEDLRRRDVTINAIAVDLRDGTVREVPGALDDLRSGVLRVLHDASFLDDPTRLWRLARYRLRLGFALDVHTAALAVRAVAAGALGTVSAARLGNELRLALAEPDPVGTLVSARTLGLAPGLDPDAGRVAVALELLDEKGSGALVTLGDALLGGGGGVPDVPFDARERVVLDGVADVPVLAHRAAAAERPSALAGLLRDEPPELVALAGAWGARAAVLRWATELRDVRLEISGADLVAAGVPQGPEVGARLRRVLDALLDGEVEAGRDAELRAALD